MDSQSLDPAPLFVTLPRASKLLGISQQTLREAAERGDLPVYQIRKRWLRVDWTEALNWMRSSRRTPRMSGGRPQ